MGTLTKVRPVAQALKLALTQRRSLSRLESNPHIYVFPDATAPKQRILSLLPTDPPTPSLAVATTTQIPPTSSSTTENPRFTSILQSVIAEHAHGDPIIQGQAAAFISSGGVSFMQPVRRQQTGSSGASDQGGHGSGGQGGYVHVSDQRHPPDFGRIADPEDIFGSVEVDGSGQFVDGHGRYQASGTYRLVTNDGILGLSDYLRTKLAERLQVEEAAEMNKK